MSSHPIVHIEFSALDRVVSGKFYSDLFGWEIQQMPEMNYATFTTGEGVGGGLNPVSENYPAGTTAVYVGTDDIETSLEKVIQLGGKVSVPKSEIPGFGWFAFFIDPAGNNVGLYTEMPQD